MKHRRYESGLAPSSVNWRNWAGNQESQVRGIFRPRSLQELQEQVACTDQNGWSLRPVGSRHSWSALVPTDGYLLDTTCLNRLLEQSEDWVHVEAGMRLRDLNSHLYRIGRKVSGLTIYEGMTIGGMVSTGSHGSGLAEGSISDEVVEMTIVCPDGEVVRIAADDLPTLRAARISLGMLGVIYSMKLRVRPAVNMRTEDLVVPLEEGLARLETIAHQHDHVSAYSLPFSDRMWFYIANRTDDPVDFGRVRRSRDRMHQYVWFSGIARVIGAVMRSYSPATPMLLSLSRGFLHNKRVVRTSRDSHHYLAAFPAIIDSEYVLPTERAAEAYRCLVAMVGEFQRNGKYPINMALHARFIRGSDAYLSPTNGCESVCLEAATLQTSKTSEVFYREWGDCMLSDFGARPHWGKLFYNLPLIRAHYGEQLTAFETARRQFDPSGRFLNPVLRELLCI